jgi:hypothetical protein
MLITGGTIFNSTGTSAALAASSNTSAHSGGTTGGSDILTLSNVPGGSVNIMETASPPTWPDFAGKHDVPMVEQYLISGRLDQGETALNAQLKANPKDDQARFGLGVLQFLQAVQDLGQSMNRYGIRNFSTTGFILPFLRLPLETNPRPEKIDYQRLRSIIEAFDKKLTQAENTLAQITDGDVKLPLHFGMIRLDLNGDGHLEESSSLWRLYAKVTNQNDIPEEKARDFYIKFDRGDVHWLRGYCHVFLTLCEIYLAHDSEEAFQRTGYIFFTRIDSPYASLARGKHYRKIGSSDSDVLDLIAFIHLIRCEVIAPQRMEAALHHMEAVIAQSRESWKWIMAETDDDHEWLPNPRQTGVIPNVQVTEKMVTAWAEIMNESERIISGKKLIPFWRGDQPLGVNVRKVFLEPRTFDLVLWVHGSAAMPYLEKGAMTTPEAWRDLRSEFGSHFPGFAIWFN